MDAKRLLDALVGALSGEAQQIARSDTGQRVGAVLGEATQGLKSAAEDINRSTGIGPRVDQAAKAVGAPAADDILRTAQDYLGRYPNLAPAALAGVGGLMLASRKARGLAAEAAALGGLALVGGLAYQAYRNHSAGRPLLGEAGGASDAGGRQEAARIAPGSKDTGAEAGRGAGASGQGGARRGLGVPRTEGLNADMADAEAPEGPGTANTASYALSSVEDEVVLYLRAMAAAAAADGQIDARERARLVEGLTKAGLDVEAGRWLDGELAQPATVEELAAGVQDAEKAARIYTAARIAIDPDTIQERDFLRRLADALALDAGLTDQIDAAAAAIKA